MKRLAMNPARRTAYHGSVERCHPAAAWSIVIPTEAAFWPTRDVCVPDELAGRDLLLFEPWNRITGVT